MIHSRALRDSARGETCTLQIAGVCCGDWDTTVLAHLASGGMGMKTDDTESCYACDTCHAAIDGRAPWDERSMKDWYARRAQARTIRRMFEKGVISIKGAK